MELGLTGGENKKIIFDCFFVMLIFGALIRFVAGIGYYNPNDTLWYKEWAMALNNGVFDIYARAEEISLDYPPLYLFLLKITGGIFDKIGPDPHGYTVMFLMKLWPIIGDVLCGAALFFVFRKQSPKAGLIASALWLFNPSTIFNSAFWGQTDGLMCLLLLLSFAALTSNKPIFACVLFAIAGMTKFQCLFFTPIFLAQLFVGYDYKKFIKGVLAAAVTVAAVFIPFMLGSNNMMLFFDVYLKGQGTYPYCTLNAYNIYGLFKLNWVEDNLGRYSNLYGISLAIIVIAVICVILIYIFAKRKCPWTISFVFMNTLFIFTTRMHERYQFVVLIFILMAALVNKHRGLFYCFVGMSIMTLLNQVIPMFSWLTEGSVFNDYYGSLMVFFSFVNILLYALSAYVSLKFLFTSGATNKNLQQTTVEEEVK